MAVNFKRSRWLMPLVYLSALAFLWYSFHRASVEPQPKQISYSEFLSEVRAGHVSDVRIEEQYLVARLKPGPSKQKEEISTERLPAMDETSLLKDLEAHGVAFSGHKAGTSWWSLALPWAIPILFFVLITGYSGRKLAQRPSALTFGKSRAKI